MQAEGDNAAGGHGLAFPSEREELLQFVEVLPVFFEVGSFMLERESQAAHLVGCYISLLEKSEILRVKLRAKGVNILLNSGYTRRRLEFFCVGGLSGGSDDGVEVDLDRMVRRHDECVVTVDNGVCVALDFSESMS